MKTVAIIGAGLSGTLLVMNLIKSNRNDIGKILLIEKSPSRIGRGIAYSSNLAYQPLNVRVRNMNLFSHQEGHFLNWLQKNRNEYSVKDLPEIDAMAFVSRKIFGDYVSSTFQKTYEAKAQGLVIEILSEEIVDITIQGKSHQLYSKSGRTFDVDATILAFGNFPPADILPGKPVFVNPWASNFLNEIETEHTVMMVGTGLTMVDVACSLKMQGHKGKIIALSRHGRLPFAHADSPDCPYPLPSLSPDCTALELLDYFKKAIRETQWSGYPWQSVFDRFRSLIPKIWVRMAITEKQTFLRHLRPFWEVCRHRMPIQSATMLNEMLLDGQLKIIAGKLEDVTFENERQRFLFKPKSGEKSILLPLVDVSVNCTGPVCDLRRVKSTLIQNMLLRGLIHPDELGIGAAIDSNGQLLDAKCKPIKHLFALGILRKSNDWESTALFEIREQAEQMSNLNQIFQ